MTYFIQAGRNDLATNRSGAMDYIISLYRRNVQFVVVNGVRRSVCLVIAEDDPLAVSE